MIRVNAAAELPDWVAWRAAATPQRVALEARGRRWTFSELDADVTRTARRLAHVGVRTGDRVATLLQNGPEAVLLAHAVPRLGATLVPLNVRLGDAEIAWQAGDVRARLLVAESRTAGAAGAAGAARPELTLVSVDADGAARLGGASLGSIDEADVELLAAHAADDVHTIIYTSGTTGRPKGAMLTFGNHWWSAIGSALNLGVHASDRWLAVLPLFHVGGLSILLRSAIYGITAVVHEAFDEAAVNRAIDDDAITIVSVVAATLTRMLDARRDRPYPATFRCALLGGGPAPRPLLERCAEAGIPVVQTYGLTETASQVATLAPGDAPSRPGSAGRPLYPNELRIGDADASGAGEILVRGPVVMAGYADRPAESARALVDGWLHTGDVGRLEDGYLYVLDRRDDLIVSGGENVYPAEVEGALLAHASVLEAGVVGAPDPRWGARVVAVVRLSNAAPVTTDQLLAHCRTLLGGFKLPSEIRFTSEPLPRTASGKLRRRALRASLGDDSP